MNETVFHDVLEPPKRNAYPEYKSDTSIDKNKSEKVKVGILGCGTIANIITNFVADGKLDVDLKFFYDQDMEKAKIIASKVDGTYTSNVNDMLDYVDLVVEAASPYAVIDVVPQILKKGKNVIIMSIGALMDHKFRTRLEQIALENNSIIYTPSGAIVGLDGVKAASMGEITEVNLITRKPPKSLGISVVKEAVIFEGNSSESVLKFPQNMNVAAALSIACNQEVKVKIIADPKINQNIHEIHVIGDFGEFKTTTKNKSCTTNPKTSIMAAYSAIKLLKSLNENSKIGT
jgi:aspartate dehydrogenase